MDAWPITFSALAAYDKRRPRHRKARLDIEAEFKKITGTDSPYPVVIKQEELCAGKGVTIARCWEDVVDHFKRNGQKKSARNQEENVAPGG